MNTQETVPVDSTTATNEETPTVSPPAEKASPFTGLIKVGQSFPLNGVWCRVAKFEGPHIFLVATEYTSKVRRFINNAQKQKQKKNK